MKPLKKIVDATGAGDAFLGGLIAVSYTHLRAHETDSYLVCRLLLEKKNGENISYFNFLFSPKYHIPPIQVMNLTVKHI